MKKKILMSTLLLTLFGGLTLSTISCGQQKPHDENGPVVPNNPDGGDSETPDKDPVVTMKLVVDTAKMKTNYFVGDKFVTDGLEVRLVTTTDGVEDEGVLTTDYTLNIEDEKVLGIDDTKVIVTSTKENVVGTSFDIVISQNQVYKYLEADVTKMKTNYYVGDTLDATGLVVKMFTNTNGVLDDGVIFTDYTLSIGFDDKLTAKNKEVIVKSNVAGVQSTQFAIKVEPRPILKSIYDYAKFLKENNNYTVDSKVGNDNEIHGLLTKNGVKWTSSVEGYFLDANVAYAEYNGNTFVFKIVDGKVSDPKYINELGGNALDYGLFNPLTVDQFAENRISNYSIQGITDDELNYLKTLKPIEGNPNKFEIEIEQSKWIWNAIGHTSLSRDPVTFLTKGTTPGRIFIELVEEGMKVSLIPPTNGYVESCVATIKNIGTTSIPGLNEFLANPEFPNSHLDEKIVNLQNLVRAHNYTVQSQDGSKIAYYSEDYSYGECLNTDPKDPLSTIYLKENNKLNLEPGYHNFVKTADSFSVEDRTIYFENTTYLTNYDIWNLLNKYFGKIEDNHYKYTVQEVLGANPQITAFIQYYLDVDIETIVLKAVDLKLNYELEKLSSVEFKVITDGGVAGTIIVKDFGTTSYEPLETYIKTLY